MSEMSDRLMKARLLAKYKTAKEATERLGLVYSTYKTHEGGHRGFSRTAARYAYLFKVDLIWLMTGVGEPRPKGAVHPVVPLFEAIPPEKRPQAIEYLSFLSGQKPQ